MYLFHKREPLPESLSASSLCLQGFLYQPKVQKLSRKSRDSRAACVLVCARAWVRLNVGGSLCVESKNLVFSFIMNDIILSI